MYTKVNYWKQVHEYKSNLFQHIHLIEDTGYELHETETGFSCTYERDCYVT
jgi:hypothetical protein